MSSKKISRPDINLPSLLDADDDEDSGEDTGILVKSMDDNNGGPFQAFAFYIHRKHSRLAKRVASMEKKLDRILWTVGGAVFIGGAAWRLIESWILKR